MPYIGGSDSFIGSNDDYIGAWTLEATITTPAFPGYTSGMWLYRNTANRVITGLSFDTLAPEESVSIGVCAQYRGHRPVKVIGFYIREIEPEFYQGTQGPQVDKNDLVRWADHFTKGAVPPGTPGLEISQTHWETEEVVTLQVKSGSGDQAATPIAYVGHENGILNRDQFLEITLRITAPSAERREILQAGRFNFGFDIEFIELSPQIEEVLVNGGCEDV